MNPSSELAIETTPLFWDCECAEEYIHPATQDECEHCHAEKESSPDARVSEVERLLAPSRCTPQESQDAINLMAKYFTPNITAYFTQ
jgi:hypothetical protein